MQASDDKLIRELRAIPGLELAPRELACLQRLAGFESQMDKVHLQKMMEIHESFTRPSLRLKGVLRVHISAGFQEQDGKEVYVVNVVGRLLSSSGPQQSLFRPRKFSSYVRAIEFVPQLSVLKPVTWNKDKAASKTDKDGFQFVGPASDTNRVRIQILLDEPHLFALGPDLAQLVGRRVASRQDIIAAIWEYIKVNNLQDKESKNFINCDALLRKIFDTDYIKMDMISLSLKKQTNALEAHVVDYEFRRGSSPEDNGRVFDIKVEIDPPQFSDLMPFFVQKLAIDPKETKNILNNTVKSHPHIKMNGKIRNLESSMMDTVEKIRRTVAKKENFQAFESDPSAFIENLILQQNKYLRMMKNSDLRSVKNAELDEKSLMEKLMGEYQDVAFDEIRKFTSKIINHEDYKE